jgi:hypothetical protein
MAATTQCRRDGGLEERLRHDDFARLFVLNTGSDAVKLLQSQGGLKGRF